MDEMKIEEMQAGDYDELKALWDKTEGIALSEKDTQEFLEGFLKRNPGLCFVARIEGRIAGSVLCGHDGRSASVYKLAIGREFRRQGIGKALVDRAVQELASIGIRACWAKVYEDNRSGLEFWESVGWEARDNLRIFRKPIEG